MSAAGSGPKTSLEKKNQVLMEFFVTIAGHVIQADQLLKKSSTLLRDDVATEYPIEHMLIMRIYNIAPELLKIFLAKFKKFDSPNAGYQEMVKLFFQDSQTFSLSGSKLGFGKFTYLNTDEGMSKISTLINELLADRSFRNALTDLFIVCKDLEDIVVAKGAEESAKSLVYKNINEVLIDPITGSQLIFAMQIPAKFPDLSRRIVKYTHGIKDEEMEDNPKIVGDPLVKASTTLVSEMNNSVGYIDYSVYNPNMALIFSVIDKLQSDVAASPNIVNEGLLQLLFLLTTMPRIIDKKNLRQELSPKDKESIKQLVGIYKGMGDLLKSSLDLTQVAKDRVEEFIMEQTDIKIRALLGVLLDDETKTEEIVEQIHGAYAQANKIVDDKSVVIGDLQHKLNTHDMEYSINRYLHSFSPPETKIEFNEARYILDFITKNNIKLTRKSIIVLQNVAPRHKTALGKFASKVRKMSISKDKKAVERPASPQEKEDLGEKDLYRRDLSNLVSGYKEGYGYVDLLACFKAATPVVAEKRASKELQRSSDGTRSLQTLDKPPLLHSQSKRLSKDSREAPPIPSSRPTFNRANSEQASPALPPNKPKYVPPVTKQPEVAKPAATVPATVKDENQTQAPTATRKLSFVQRQKEEIEARERKQREEKEAAEAAKRKSITGKRGSIDKRDSTGGGPKV